MKLRVILSSALMAMVLVAPVATHAQGLSAGVTPFLGTQGGSLSGAIQTIVNVMLMIVGVIAAVMLIIGGVRYIISQGDEDQTEKAKNTILYALIGLIVIGLSAVIINFVLGAVAGNPGGA
ncbi:MAG: pilin [Candidatus Andersenbacteria bacterium]